jgi:hypothetical protein
VVDPVDDTYRRQMNRQLTGLVLNAVVVSTTRYIDAAVAQLRGEGHEIAGEDIARLSPLKHRNLNVLGRYSFTPSTPASGALRPLRDPDAANSTTTRTAKRSEPRLSPQLGKKVQP